MSPSFAGGKLFLSWVSIYIFKLSIHNRGRKHRGPIRPNYPSNFVWMGSQLSLVNYGLFSWPIRKDFNNPKILVIKYQ